MAETEKPTNPYDPCSENMEADKTASERMPEEAREKLKETREFASEQSEQKERLAEKWSETAEKGKRVAREPGNRAKNAGAAAYESIGENLLPTILTGIGAAWLMASIVRNRSSRSDYDYDYEQEYARGFYGEPSSEAESVKSRIEDKAGEMADRARMLKERAREGSRRTKEKSWEFVSSNPFYAAGAAMAAGLLVGLAFPQTRAEQSLFRDVRDELPEA